MVKLGINISVILLTITFIMGCTFAKNVQTSTESQKKSKEAWIKNDVVTKDSKYSYKIPGDSKPLSKELLGEVSKRALETNGDGVEIETKSGFSFNTENKTESELPLVATKSVGKDDRMFNGIKEILKDYWVLRDGAVVCENDKELAEAIQKNPVETLIISKNRNAVVVKESEEIEKEKCTILGIMYMGENSVAYFVFAEKENKFNDTLPLFLKIGETVAFAK
ncbi:hypothetical protein [Aneurinibacillus uraniidurans]|uniref:hypothetical protein n=1 Tax=Aneurinibacillus uraniidurans TaxID=2966586 RepID=UPI0023493C3B|nr:hypothetical protein [Aneurinibacillus sp. B1]WCN36513.1 hypothetical protein PO771_11545 [Aneurinibacillus sp. B1]